MKKCVQLLFASIGLVCGLPAGAEVEKNIRQEIQESIEQIRTSKESNKLQFVINAFHALEQFVAEHPEKANKVKQYLGRIYSKLGDLYSGNISLDSLTHTINTMMTELLHGKEVSLYINNIMSHTRKLAKDGSISSDQFSEIIYQADKILHEAITSESKIEQLSHLLKTLPPLAN